jgi:hypothetical protein
MIEQSKIYERLHDMTPDRMLLHTIASPKKQKEKKDTKKNIKQIFNFT